MTERQEIFIGNGTVVTGGDDVISGGAVLIGGDGRVAAVGPETTLRADSPDSTYLDARGGVILPGLVNLHHHFYSALARGLDPGVAMNNFPEVLDRLWWRLDRALDHKTIGISAELALADSIRWGTTTVFDHHASPAATADSLDVIAAAVEWAGLSAVLCYEVSDRNGRDEAQAGLDENFRFLQSRREDPRIRGVLGLHASFTLRDETLERAAQQRQAGDGCHIHLAEDPADLQASRDAFGLGPVQRLVRFGLLDDNALLAHGIHLGNESYETIANYNATLIHNPESNANNGVGMLDLPMAAGHGCLIGLGTDGMSGAMLRSLRSSFLIQRGTRQDPTAGFDVLPQLLGNNVAVARRFFDEPLLGELTPGAPADIAVIDAPPPTPLNNTNLFAHMVYGMAEAPVRHTIARGRVLLKDFEHQTLDPREIAARAREQAPALWQRFHDLAYGTQYLGD